MATAREELHRVIDKLQDKDVESLLHLLRRIIPEGDELTPDEVRKIEKAKVQMAKGEYVELESLKKEFGL